MILNAPFKISEFRFYQKFSLGYSGRNTRMTSVKFGEASSAVIPSQVLMVTSGKV
jgi:hypothetical protein